ncbi:MAG: hypothetical protein QNJ54_08065 [Prochloraceae cyanobacterium]|nr:hypothetical protein [Prochloraceae cyanobacterium]
MLLYTTREKLELQSTPGNASSQIIFQDKLLTRGPDFAKNLKEAAIGFCKLYSQSKSLCLLVENSSYLSIWKEEFKKDAKSKQNKQTQKEKLATPTANPLQGNDLPVNLEFFARCQQELTELIGPIAAVICKETFYDNPGMKQIEFVKALAEEISCSGKAMEFEKRLLS